MQSPMDFTSVKNHELVKTIGLERRTQRTELHVLLYRRRATSQLSVSYPSGIRRSSALTTSLERRLAPRFPRNLEETNPDAIREARKGTPRDPEYVAGGGTERNSPLIR